MPIKHADAVPREIVKAGQGTTRQVLIGPDEAPNFALRRFIMEPGGGIPAHTNTVEHEQYVLRGRAKSGSRMPWSRSSPGRPLYSAGTPHWYEVQGGEPSSFSASSRTSPTRSSFWTKRNKGDGCL